MLTVGTGPRHLAGLTELALCLEPGAALLTVLSHSEGITSRTGLGTIIEEDLAEEPAPLGFRQGVLTRPGPEALGKLFEQAPGEPRLLGLGQELAQGLLVMAETAGPERRLPPRETAATGHGECAQA